MSKPATITRSLRVRFVAAATTVAVTSAGCANLPGMGRGGGGSAGLAALVVAPTVLNVVLQMKKDQQDKVNKQVLNATVADSNLEELVTAAGQDLGKRLVEIPATKASDHQLILTITEIEDKTDTRQGQDPSVGGELATLRTQLVNDPRVHGSYVIVDRSRDSAMKLTTEIAGAANDPSKLSQFDDPAQRTTSTTAAVVYNPDDIYILSGKFFVNDNKADVQDHPQDRRITYLLSVDVLHGRSGQIAASQTYKRHFHWDADQKTFAPDA